MHVDLRTTTCLLQADDVAASGESQRVTWWWWVVMGVLVAKQQAGKKPKGLRTRDEQSERRVCVCVRENEGRPTDKSFCRHHCPPPPTSLPPSGRLSDLNKNVPSLSPRFQRRLQNVTADYRRFLNEN